MEDVLMLLGQIFILACIQSVFNMFIDDDKSPFLSKFLGIAGYAGAFLLVLQFVVDNLMPEILNMMTMSV